MVQGAHKPIWHRHGTKSHGGYEDKGHEPIQKAACYLAAQWQCTHQGPYLIEQITIAHKVQYRHQEDEAFHCLSLNIYNVGDDVNFLKRPNRIANRLKKLDFGKAQKKLLLSHVIENYRGLNVYALSFDGGDCALAETVVLNPAPNGDIATGSGSR